MKRSLIVLPLLTTSHVFAKPYVAADCPNYIATNEHVYCLTSRGAPTAEVPSAPSTDVTPFDYGVVYDEDGLWQLDIQNHEEDETNDQVP